MQIYVTTRSSILGKLLVAQIIWNFQPSIENECVFTEGTYPEAFHTIYLKYVLISTSYPCLDLLTYLSISGCPTVILPICHLIGTSHINTSHPPVFDSRRNKPRRLESYGVFITHFSPDYLGPLFRFSQGIKSFILMLSTVFRTRTKQRIKLYLLPLVCHIFCKIYETKIFSNLNVLLTACLSISVQ
jgi:hypothetical protein